jgi:hypothetical protein
MRDGVLALLRLSVEGHRGIVVELGTVRLAFIGSVTQRGEGQRSLGEAQGEWQRALDGAVRLVRRNTEEIELRDPCRPPFSAELLAEGAERHNIERLTSTSALVIDEEGNDVTDDTLRLIRLDEFLSTPDSPVKYRVDRLLCVGAKVLLVAQWKAGKSTTVGNLTRSLVDEVPFLGEFAVEPFTGSVVVIDDELSEGQLRRWLREQGIRNTQRVHVMPLRGRAERFNLLDPEVMDRWVSMLQEVDCAVLIFDCLRPVLDAIGLSEDKEAGRFVEALSTLLYRADVGESVIVHHMGHNGERARGDSSLRGKTDAEWKMVRAVGTDDAGREVDDPSAPRFFSAFGRDVDVPEGALEYDEPARRLTYLGGNRKEVKIRSVLISVLEYVKDHQPVNKGEIEKALGGDNKVVRSAMADGIKDGLLAESRQGTAKPLSLTQDGYAYISRFGVPVVLGGDHAPESLVGFGFLV